MLRIGSHRAPSRFATPGPPEAVALIETPPGLGPDGAEKAQIGKHRGGIQIPQTAPRFKIASATSRPMPSISPGRS